MALLPDSLRLTAVEELELAEIRREAKVQHEKDRKAAKRRGRIHFPMLPYECSWAYEMQFLRQRRVNRG